MVFDMRFPGQRFDTASRFNQNYFRDYDAATGRYGQSDPIGLRGGLNSYSYANNRPFFSSDPFGLRAPFAQESAFIGTLFGSSFDTASLDIQQASGSRGSSLRGSNVKLPRSLFIDGDIGKGIDLNKIEARSTLAHEVFHVWQRRRGAKVTSRLILPQVGYTLGFGSPYAYASPSSAEQASQYFNALFGDGKYEAQAQLWEDSYLASDSSSLAGEIWTALQNEVQNGCVGQ